MLPNAFIGKPKKPTDRELGEALGPSKALWDQLVDGLKEECDLTPEWNSYSPKAGWSLRLKHKKRNIVYFGPCQGSFRVAFVLGDKAVQAARESTLPQRVIKIINESKRYPEGLAVRMDVKSGRDIAAIKTLAEVKLEN